ncbi:MFS transporter [Roseibium suaedae]|uniref:MFS transporter, UMF1 family n=1 Tax=Roseibium suaedae TaxID=735517 RepID=A0A1M7MZ31_9HYPH|nr:MFS transporter [Roseibium suaedae]SHM95898.1 MFS transporter, UMF1 family [Roseibium suaedae]
MSETIPPARPLALWSWILFDWAGQPFFTLVTTFIFAPFVATALAETPEQGQALWGFATSASGLAIALFAPVLGAIADATGHRKPWILAFSIPFVIACAVLWFAEPGTPYGLTLALLSFSVATLCMEFATTFNNAMMTDLVPRTHVGRLSGTGWAVGYVGGLVSLVLVLGFLAASPETGKTLLGQDPLFGSDPASRAGDRATGPLSALWYAVFVLPLFLFTPDAPRRSALGPAVRIGIATLVSSLRLARTNKRVFLFLLANMAYKDGLVALFAFGGIYSASQLGWEAFQIGIFAILLTVAGTFGAILGGRMDDRYGPKRVLFASLILLTIGSLGVISIDRDTILFVMTVPASQTPGLTGSLPELLFLFFGGVIGFAAGPLQSASRSLLVHLAPEENIGQYFGLLALSGKVTSFLAPLAVSLVTVATGSLAAGMSPILAFLALGAVLLARVR